MNTKNYGFKFIVATLWVTFFFMVQPYNAAAQMESESESLQLETVVVDYQIPNANKVLLGWGIDGWKTIDSSLWPSGSALIENVVYSPMVQSGEVFTAELQVPSGSELNYGFLIVEDNRGVEMSIWEVGSNSATPLIINRPRKVTYESEKPLFSKLHIQFSNPGASTVNLVWGINGWSNVSTILQPEGTEIVDGVMHSPMVMYDDVFGTELEVPTGSSVNFGFSTTEILGGIQTKNWELGTSKDEPFFVTEDIEIAFQSEKVLPALVEQRITYFVPGASEVKLLWGVNGWQALPNKLRPDGTEIVAGVMQIPMKRQNNTFEVDIPVLTDSPNNYGFLVTSAYVGIPTSVWDNQGGEDNVILGESTEAVTVSASKDIIEKVRREAINLVLPWTAGIFIVVATLWIVFYVVRKRKRRAS